MKLHHKVLDLLYETSVFLSYNAPGYKLRSLYWQECPQENLSQKLFAVTGATSGVGKAICEALASLGAKVLLIGRNAQKLHLVQKELISKYKNRTIMIEQANLSSLESIERLVARFKWYPQLHCLIHNAGVMLHKHTTTEDNIEETFATNVVSGFLLTARLLPLLKLSAPARLIHVTSGGMYTQKIKVDELCCGGKKYDGVVAYAQSKRAQVILNRKWAELLAPYQISSNCMHPGWANTPGVEMALPGFYKLFKNMLRTPAQGADTAVWLATHKFSETGKLWLDRKARREHVFPWTRETHEQAEKLWQLLLQLTKVDPQKIIQEALIEP